MSWSDAGGPPRADGAFDPAAVCPDAVHDAARLPPHQSSTACDTSAKLARRAVLLAPLALVACGFQPVYGPGGTGSVLQNRVAVAAPDDRASYLLVRRLEDRLGRATDPAYTLALSLRTEIVALGIDPAGNIDRYNLIGTARYVLTDAETGVETTSGTINSFTGYVAAGSTVETLAAERDALERLMVILADQIVARLLAAPLN
jgi:LPS-assembly lipoprotein